MPRFALVPLAALALAATLPLSADDKKPPADTREIVGTDQVNVYWCPHKKDFWTQTAETAKACPYCEGDPATCGSAVGDFKIVVRTKPGSLKAGSEAGFDIEVFQIVVDKDAKPDEVRVTDVATVKAKFTHGKTNKDGDFESDEDGKVLDGKIAGEKKIATVTQALKKGEYKLGMEIIRGDKDKTKIECEVEFRVD